MGGLSLVLLLVAPLVRAQTATSTTPGHEAQLLAAWQAFFMGDTGGAMETLSGLGTQRADFSLARLAYADFLYAQMGVLPDMGGGLPDDLAQKQAAERGSMLFSLDALQLEAKRRAGYAKGKRRLVVQKVQDEAAQQRAYPASVIQLSDKYPRLLLVDGEQARVEVYAQRNGALQPLDDFYSSVARNGMHKSVEGDKRTPVGVYFTTQRLAEDGLGELYGAGAISLNYPNVWDRVQQRSGHGIWLHGVPYSTYNRAPLATNGCVALANTDYQALDDALGLSVTPVVVVNERSQISDKIRAQKAKELNLLLANWQKVQNVGSDAALESFYTTSLSQDYRVGKKWSRGKKNVRDVSIFQYPTAPDEAEMVLLTFDQYAVDTPEQYRHLRQYWQLKNDSWLIVAEETDAVLPVHLRGIPPGVVRSKHVIASR